MPTDTFNNLSENKKTKIIIAAKKEFTRVPFEETSINKIVEEAGIARGSFYQYFKSKEDLLSYIMKKDIAMVDDNIEQVLKNSNGDIFEMFLYIYDKMSEHTYKEDVEFHKRIFENIKTSQDSFFFLEMEDKRKQKFEKFYHMINTEILNVENEEDLKIIFKILMVITRKAIVSNFKYQSREEARRIYLKEMKYLKHGIAKKEREVKTC